MKRIRRALTTKMLTTMATTLAVLVALAIALPLLLTLTPERSIRFGEFPVTVDPANKRIVEDDAVNALLEGAESPLATASLSAGTLATRIFTSVAATLGNTALYQTLAAGSGRFVVIYPGMRREQVAIAFGTQLGWSAAERKEFLTPIDGASLPLPEGSFIEGVYLVERSATPHEVQALVNERFSELVIARYSSTTAAKVPLHDALTIASMIEREAGGADDIRLISGIMWNRLFLGMPLQIDATVQYVKASTSAGGGWWPRIVSGDQRRRSPYNTYLNKGLPPGPIATPSVAALLATLNPKSTSCLFYFHHDDGSFYCSDTYADHVAKLKSFYGRGR